MKKPMFPRLFTALLLLALAMPVLAASVNINQAPASTLADELSGVGESRAAAIVDHRETNGPFRNVDDLRKVRGIGAATLEQNRHKLSTGDDK
ncbi:MAG: ComEA family DNA-binding protein [Pseudomonadota bacterium]